MGVSVLAVDNARGVWGAQHVLLRLAGPVADLGVQITLFAPGDSEFAAVWRDAGLALRADKSLAGMSPRTASGSVSARAVARMASDGLGMSGRVAGAARAGSYDLLHGNGHGSHLQTAIAARLSGRPALLHLHEELPHRFGRALRAASVRCVRHSLAVSPSIRDSLGGAGSSRVCVLPNGIDLNRFAAQRPVEPDRVLTIAAITRIDPAKRIDDLLDALLPLRDRADWRATVVGEPTTGGDYADRVRRRAAEEFAGRVQFRGWVADVAPVLEQADLLIHTGVVEGTPLVLLEAQAAGVPVIAYHIAGIPDVIVAGRTGFLAATGNIAELSVHIERLLGDASLRARMGEAAREQSSRFALNRQAEAYAAVVHAIVGGEDPACVAEPASEKCSSGETSA